MAPSCVRGAIRTCEKVAANVDKALTELANGLTALKTNPRIELQFLLPLSGNGD
jgi:hypothetical protein